MKLMYSSVKDAHFGNDFILFPQFCRHGIKLSFSGVCGIKLSLVELGCPSLMRIAVDVGVK
jgi:hypothetical protein